MPSKIIPDGIVKELNNQPTHPDLDADKDDEIRDVVTLIVHNLLDKSAPMEVEKRITVVVGDVANDDKDDGYYDAINSDGKR